MNKHQQNIIRWILFLPGSVLIAICSLFLMHWCLYFTLREFISPYPEFPERALTPFIFAMTLIWSGSQIAPNNRFKVAILIFAISIFISGGTILTSLTGGTLFGETLYFQVNGVASVMGIIGAFVGLYLSKDRTKITYSVPSEKEDLLTQIVSDQSLNKVERISFYKKFGTELFTLFFIAVLTFCLYFEKFRFWAFVVILSIIILGFIIDLSLKKDLYSTTTSKINLIKNIVSTIALVIGMVNTSAGYYISIAFLVLYIFEFMRCIIMTRLIK